MVIVRNAIVIRGEMADVFRCFWDAELWPRITPHVKRIQMLEDDEGRQRFLMTVESDGRAHTVETERTAAPNRSISYQQRRPPTFLRRHGGRWTFKQEPDGVRVSLVHEAEIDESRLGLIGAATMEEAEAIVGRSLGANGARTMDAVKEYVENRRSRVEGVRRAPGDEVGSP